MANRWICLSDQEIDEIKESLRFVTFDTIKVQKLRKKLDDAQKRIKISSAKGKGRELQNWMCERISGLIGIPYVQADDDALIHGREMGQNGVDVILRGKARKLFPFAIECKSTEQLSLTATIKQVQANQPKDMEWMIVHRNKAIQDTVIIISWRTFRRVWLGLLQDFSNEVSKIQEVGKEGDNE